MFYRTVMNINTTRPKPSGFVRRIKWLSSYESFIYLFI